jgi:hypothetical protein
MSPIKPVTTAAACLLACTLAASGTDQKFAAYGTIVQGFECDIFATQDGTVYALENLGDFGVGDCVYVEGTLAACDDTCLWHKACILDNGIVSCCRGDVNGDFVVDIQDLISVVLDFGCVGKLGPCMADVNLDDHVDVDDMIEVLTNWGPCAVP